MSKPRLDAGVLMHWKRDRTGRREEWYELLGPMTFAEANATERILTSCYAYFTHGISVTKFASLKKLADRGNTDLVRKGLLTWDGEDVRSIVERNL